MPNGRKHTRYRPVKHRRKAPAAAPQYGPLYTGCPAVELAIERLYQADDSAREDRFWGLIRSLNYALQMQTRVLVPVQMHPDGQRAQFSWAEHPIPAEKAAGLDLWTLNTPKGQKLLPVFTTPEQADGSPVTLGLPIIRSSVDHGTGFGHAGEGFLRLCRQGRDGFVDSLGRKYDLVARIAYINSENVAIVAEDDAEVTILSTDDTPNGALASQDMIAIVSDNVVLAGLRIGTRFSDNKAVDVIGNNVTIDTCTFIDGSALYIAEFDQADENNIDKVTVQYCTFEDGATVSFTSGVGGDIRFNDNTMRNDSALYLTGSRNSGWNPVGIDVSEADFSGNTFEAGAMLRIAYEADDKQNASLASFDASSVADNLGDAEESTGAYEETIKLYTAN